ncbi:hypothetical protein NPIL_255531 [Nephila pilipes]|uniref:Uncharacterized protein n=1 Tax=Nephila pilipes TaxID=299642 RepID=A0A8X6JX56_NEPPI|nr:hypothetical protein NPIL_255531 [Nephila pilipes]
MLKKRFTDCRETNRLGWRTKPKKRRGRNDIRRSMNVKRLCPSSHQMLGRRKERMNEYVGDSIFGKSRLVAMRRPGGIYRSEVWVKTCTYPATLYPGDGLVYFM